MPVSVAWRPTRSAASPTRGTARPATPHATSIIRDDTVAVLRRAALARLDRPREEEKAANDNWTQLQFEAAQSTTPMTEIDLRSDNRNPGIPLDPLVVDRDIYRLLAIFGASREIAARRSGEDDKGSVYGYSIREFELSEVGRLLVSLAACFRNAWDRRSESIDDALAACAESSRGRRAVQGY